MTVYVQGPSPQQIIVHGANIDRYVAVIQSCRELSGPDGVDQGAELATIIKAAEEFSPEGMRVMFAIMLQREADRR